MLGSQKLKQLQHQKMKVISTIDDGSSVNSQGGTKVVNTSKGEREKVVVPIRLAPMHQAGLP